MKPTVRASSALLVLAGLLFVTTTSKHTVQPVHADWMQCRDPERTLCV